MKHPEVRSIHSIRIHEIGGKLFIAFHLEFKSDLKLESTYLISDEIEGEIRGRIKEVGGTIIHIEPPTKPG